MVHHVPLARCAYYITAKEGSHTTLHTNCLTKVSWVDNRSSLLVLTRDMWALQQQCTTNVGLSPAAKEGP